MNALRKGIVLGALQCTLVLSLTGKLFYDRATCPRAWVKTQRYDPDLPIRGRYLSLMLAPDAGAPYFDRTSHQRVVFFVPEHPVTFEAEITIPRQGRRVRFNWASRKTARFSPFRRTNESSNRSDN